MVDGQRRLVTALGPDLVDLHAAAMSGVLASVDPAVMTTGRLNELLAAGRAQWTALREELLGVDLEPFRRPHSEGGMQLAWEVQDYVDFFASREHAENAGRIFRPDGDWMSPNWLHVPIGYHGRAASVVVDGTPIRRPNGQRLEADGSVTFGPCRALDFELEVGTVLGGANRIGEPISIDQVSEYLFGVVLVNDWSARDIQLWESQPLGPFLGKSFATSVSAWVVTFDALAHDRRSGPRQDPPPLPYLTTGEPWHVDLDLEAWIRPPGDREATRVTTVNAGDHLYWSAAQQLAHLTSNGAAIRAGDLFASGTVSGSTPDEMGSLLEKSWNGTRPFEVGDTTRTFLEDGDEVTLSARAGDHILGPVRGSIIPA